MLLTSISTSRQWYLLQAHTAALWYLKAYEYWRRRKKKKITVLSFIERVSSEKRRRGGGGGGKKD
jgi:hypothetical protein